MSAEPAGTGPVKLPRASGSMRAVLRVLLDAGKPLGCREIADRGGLNPNTVRYALRRLSVQGLVGQRPRIGITRWQLTPAGDAAVRSMPAQQPSARQQQDGPGDPPGLQASRLVLHGLMARAGIPTVVGELAPGVPAPTVLVILRGLRQAGWVYGKSLGGGRYSPYGWALTAVGLRQAPVWLARHGRHDAVAAGGEGR